MTGAGRAGEPQGPGGAAVFAVASTQCASYRGPLTLIYWPRLGYSFTYLVEFSLANRRVLPAGTLLLVVLAKLLPLLHPLSARLSAWTILPRFGESHTRTGIVSAKLPASGAEQIAFIPMNPI